MFAFTLRQWIRNPAFLHNCEAYLMNEESIASRDVNLMDIKNASVYRILMYASRDRTLMSEESMP